MQLSGLAALKNAASRRLARLSQITSAIREDVEFADKEDFGDQGSVYKFGYPNYNLDPKPRVLVLGFYNHPQSGNTLLGGLNLNYMTADEVAEVKTKLPLILRPKNLKERYWAGRKLLPDIFKSYYRTYNKGYASRLIKPADLEPQMAGKGTGSQEPTRDIGQQQPQQKLTGKIRDLQQPRPPEQKPEQQAPQQGPERVERIRQALNRPRPETADRPEPQPEKLLATSPPAIDGKPGVPGQPPGQANRELMLQKAAAAQKDRDKLKGDLRDRLRTKLIDKAKDKIADKEVEKLVAPVQQKDQQKGQEKPKNPLEKAIINAAKKGLKPKQKPQRQLRGGIGNDAVPQPGDNDAGISGGNYGDDQDSTSPDSNVIGRLGTDKMKEGYTRHPILGLLWESRSAYRRLHGPSAFLTNKRLIEDTARARYGCSLLAVVNARTGETLLDQTIDHSQIIAEAGWNYQEVIRLLPVRNSRTGVTRIHVLHEGIDTDAVRRALRKIPKIAVQALRAQ